MGVVAVNDLLRNFWVGDLQTGHILDTYGGLARTDHDPRGVIWERGMCIIALTTYYDSTGDPTIKQRLSSDWTHLNQTIPPPGIETVGVGSYNPGQDDAGWAAIAFLDVYHVTGNPDALHAAEDVFEHAFHRWNDNTLGGGLWYNDKHVTKSIYQVAQILVGLKLYGATHDPKYLQQSLSLYDWAEKTLLNPDGLYWCDCDANGPRDIGDIREASSTVFLAGDIAMGAIHALLYKLTGKEIYKTRALRTAEAILQHETDGNGHFLDDRDAWCTATFMEDWVSDVLTLPGIAPVHRNLVKRTALAILQYSRTTEGYYGGCWHKCSSNQPCAWNLAGSVPQQIMTTANSVNVVESAALLEKFGY